MTFRKLLKSKYCICKEVDIYSEKPVNKSKEFFKKMLKDVGVTVPKNHKN